MAKFGERVARFFGKCAKCGSWNTGGLFATICFDCIRREWSRAKKRRAALSAPAEEKAP